MNFDQFYILDVIIICGLPNSGKSHLAKNYFDKDNRKRINRKEIRKHLYEMTNFGKIWNDSNFNEHDEFLVKHVERKIYEHFLQNNFKVLIDNTSVTEKSRSNYINFAKQMNKTIGGIYINTSLNKCMQRNHKEPFPIMDSVITNLYAAKQLPQKKEGFDELIVIDDY